MGIPSEGTPTTGAATAPDDEREPLSPLEVARVAFEFMQDTGRAMTLAGVRPQDINASLIAVSTQLAAARRTARHQEHVGEMLAHLLGAVLALLDGEAGPPRPSTNEQLIARAMGPDPDHVIAQLTATEARLDQEHELRLLAGAALERERAARLEAEERLDAARQMRAAEARAALALDNPDARRAACAALVAALAAA